MYRAPNIFWSLPTPVTEHEKSEKNALKATAAIREAG